MIAGVVLFAAAAEEVVLHPGDPLSGFSRLLVALAIGLALLAQTVIVLRARGQLLVARLAAAIAVGLLMIPKTDLRADLALFVALAIVVTALVIERRSDRMIET